MLLNITRFADKDLSVADSSGGANPQIHRLICLANVRLGLLGLATYLR